MSAEETLIKLTENQPELFSGVPLYAKEPILKAMEEHAINQVEQFKKELREEIEDSWSVEEAYSRICSLLEPYNQNKKP